MFAAECGLPPDSQCPIRRLDTATPRPACTAAAAGRPGRGHELGYGQEMYLAPRKSPPRQTYRFRERLPVPACIVVFSLSRVSSRPVTHGLAATTVVVRPTGSGWTRLDTGKVWAHFSIHVV